MLKWIKVLIGNATDDVVIAIFSFIYDKLPVKEGVDKFCGWLSKLALKTENEVDDALVVIIHDLLYRAFKLTENPQ